jgi:hypothetical protein
MSNRQWDQAIPIRRASFWKGACSRINVFQEVWECSSEFGGFNEEGYKTKTKEWVSMEKVNKNSKVHIETEYIAGIGEWPKSANVGELMGDAWRLRLCHEVKNKWRYSRKAGCEVWFSPLMHCLDRNWARPIAIFSSQTRALSILPIEKPRVSHCNIDRHIIFIRAEWENLYSKAFT